jgi:hypothetical protein
MEIMGWVAVGVTVWTVVSVLLALAVGAAIRAGSGPRRRPAARRVPAHTRHGLGCAGGRMVADAA